MNNSLKLLPLLLLGATASLAQAPATATTKTKTTTVSKMQAGKKMQDCCMMKDGKMMMMKDGKMMPMTADMTMSDGTLCTTNGTCVRKDGTKMSMKDGQCMMMDGKMTTMGHSLKSGKMKSKSKMEGMKM